MKKPLSDVLNNFTPSVTLAISEKSNKLKDEGVKLYSFGIGEPDFAVNDEIKEAAIDAIRNDYSHYTAVNGIYELRRAICGRLKTKNGLDYLPENILCSNGAKHALSTALTALLSRGEEVIIPAPYWVSYCEMVTVAGGVPVIVQTDFENGFLLTPEALRKAITPQTKALLLNNPSNPTGNIYSKEQLAALAEVCLAEGIYIISDEIYDEFIYENKKHFSVAALSEEVKDITLTINGFSKTYAMPGWRLGYTAANNEIIKAMGSIQGQCVSHPCAIAQMAGIKALTMPQGFVADMVKEYDRRRRYMMSVLDSVEGIGYVHPLGAFYIFADINAFINKEYKGKLLSSSAVFAEILLEEANVVVIPGSGFGKENFIRLSYACSYDDIVSGMDRLKTFLEGVK